MLNHQGRALKLQYWGSERVRFNMGITTSFGFGYLHARQHMIVRSCTTGLELCQRLRSNHLAGSAVQVAVATAQQKRTSGECRQSAA